jgi:HlyD family secretion protein
MGLFSKRQRLRKVVSMTAIVVLLPLVGFISIERFLRRGEAADRVVRISGRIESDDAAVAAKVAGRVLEIKVREGDSVKAGQVLAVLEGEQVRARVEQARSAVEQAQARLRHARQQIFVLQQALEQGRLSAGQSQQEANGRVKQAEAQLAASEAEAAQAEAMYEQAQYDAEKTAQLVAKGIESERAAKHAQVLAQAQAAVLRAAKKKIEAARGALDAVKADLVNPTIRSSQTVALQQQLLQGESDIAALTADAERAQAQLKEAEADRDDLIIRAPFDGIIAFRSAEPGEVITAGTPVVTLLNPSEVYLRAFVPQGEIGRIKVGQPARVYLDSDIHHPLDAVVSRVDPRAAFTPENIYFQNDRVKQVVGVKLLIKVGDGYAKPGMSGDGEILIEGDRWTPKAD